MWRLGVKQLKISFKINLKAVIFHLGGTATIQNGAFVTDPDFPLTKYVNALYFPCVASIDENTGFLSGIKYPNAGVWYGLNDTWKYNFTEGKFYLFFHRNAKQRNLSFLIVILSSALSDLRAFLIFKLISRI
jgi:hypothetical protein